MRVRIAAAAKPNDSAFLEEIALNEMSYYRKLAIEKLTDQALNCLYCRERYEC